MALQIGNVQIGASQINEASPKVLKTVANTVIILSGLIALVIAPMPVTWIPNDLRVYLLTVAASSGGFLKVLEKLTGQAPPSDSPQTPTV